MDNVLIVATTSYAGMGPYVVEIVNSFYSDDNVYYFFRDYEDGYFKNNVKNELYDNSVFYNLPNSKWNKVKDLIRSKYPFHNEIIELCEQKNISLVHFINNPGSKLLVKALLTRGIISVSTVHDLHPHEAKKVWYKMLRWRRLNKRVYSNLIYNSNLVTNSINQFEELKRMFPTKRIYFHSFPSLVTDAVASGNDIPSELKDLNKPYILFFGRIEKYKGVILLYEIFKENTFLNNNYNLVIAGQGDIGLKRSINENNIIFINRYILDSEIKYLYEHACCVVYPYISATQSGVLSLAFYFKVPTITSDIPYFTNIMKDIDNNCIFRSQDKKDLLQKICILLKSNNENLCNKEYDYYLKYYDKASIRRDLLKIYSDIINMHLTNYKR